MAWPMAGLRQIRPPERLPNATSGPRISRPSELVERSLGRDAIAIQIQATHAIGASRTLTAGV